MKKLFILPLLILSGLSTYSFAQEAQLTVEVTTKNQIEKSCSLQLYEDFLVIEQKISNERGKDELVVDVTYKPETTQIKISSDQWVDSKFEKSRRLFLRNKSVGIEKVLATEGIIFILEELLKGTAFAEGQSGSYEINAVTIANAFRANCK